MAFYFLRSDKRRIEEWITRSTLQTECRGIYPLHNQTVQEVNINSFKLEKERRKFVKRNHDRYP